MSAVPLELYTVRDFADFRTIARPLVGGAVTPESVQFCEYAADRPLLFSGEANEVGKEADRSTAGGSGATFRISKDLMQLFEAAALHRDSDRWQFLYRCLYRSVHGGVELLRLEADPDVLRLRRMESAVRRDAHKMKAFVRFRKVQAGDREHFIAFHRPDHYIVRRTAPFFAERFAGMRWTILTPDESVHWDMNQLHFGPGVPASAAPQYDELEAMWLTYYRSIFNPARIKYQAMVAELPVRHWPTLPESAEIAAMMRQAPARVETMIKRTEGFNTSAADFLPPDPGSIEQLRQAAADCRGCPLYAPATQTVFGVGNPRAALMLVGEQPGDKEDLAGEPFVGPAGKVLSDALEEVGLSREDVYLTNAVKHFKFELRGKFRLHAKPGAREIAACKPWLQEELRLVQPAVLVCLGATAAQAIIGRGFSITKQRGEFLASEFCPQTIATYHPSAILRVPDKEAAENMFRALVTDLTAAKTAAR